MGGHVDEQWERPLLCDNAWSSIWGIRAVSISSRLLFNTGNKGMNTTKVRLGNHVGGNKHPVSKGNGNTECLHWWVLDAELCERGLRPRSAETPFLPMIIFPKRGKLSPRHPPPHFIPSPSQTVLFATGTSTSFTISLQVCEKWKKLCLYQIPSNTPWMAKTVRLRMFLRFV